MWKETQKEKERQTEVIFMEETMEQEYEIEVLPFEEETPAEENPLDTKGGIVAAAEYFVGAGIGFTVSDLAFDKLTTMQKAFFMENPAAWWLIPISKGVIGTLLLFGASKIKEAGSGKDMKRLVTGMGIGVYADIANDLIQAFQVDVSLGVERTIFVSVT